MAFRYEHETKNGKISISLNRELDTDEFLQIAQFTDLILSKTDIIEGEIVERNVISNQQHSNKSIGRTLEDAIQERLGPEFRPGVYKEPEGPDLFRIKFLCYEAEHKLDAVKAIRAHTGIAIITCRDILDNKVKCPKFTKELAERIMVDMKRFEVYARIVPAEENAEIAA